MTYFPPDTQNGTIDPFPPTLVDLNDTKYEYARGYGTLEDPPNLGSIATGKLAIIGVHTTPVFYKAIDVNVGILSSVTQYVSVHSEPHIFYGITAVTNEPYVTVGIKTFDNATLINAWHFRSDPFVEIESPLGVGIASTSGGVNIEYGYYFDKNVTLSNYSFGFYYGDQNPGNDGLPSHKRWATFMETDTGTKEAWNFFEDLVLVGDYESIGSLDINHPEPLVQILRPDHQKRGLYVRDTVGIGTTTDKRIQLYVDSSNNPDATHALKVIGNTEITGSLSKGSGTFDIIHPLEETKRLRHSFVEGPRYDNIYRNRVKLTKGKAKVNLDLDCVSPGGQVMTHGTWEKLNRNPDIFLQNLDDWSRLKGKINGSTLEIECENLESNDLVSWMVIAERQDEFILNSNISDDKGRLILEYEG